MIPSARWALSLLSFSSLAGLLNGCLVTSRSEPGAAVPWTRHEAEQASSNVHATEVSRAYLTPESEAAGRRLVRLEKPGDYVEFAVTRPANGLVLRYSIPDNTDGTSVDATLGLVVNGAVQPKLNLTSRFAWSYGDFPWTNNPSAGRGHHFFDEVQVVIPAVQPGDTIRLARDEQDAATYYDIDFIELELVPAPLPRPTNSVSIEEFGGTGEGDGDDAEAYLRMIEAARHQNKVAWIPAGTYSLGGSFKAMGGVEIQGAGMWHTRLTGSGAMFYGTGERFAVRDLAVFGLVNARNDMSPDNFLNGNLGVSSVVERVWIEHMKCGIWSNHGTKHLRVSGCRIRNTMADGVNLCDGTTDSVVEQSHVRNTGDDALATWSPSGDWSSKQICERNRFLFNTIENPWHANGLGIYGGRDHEAHGNLVLDTVQSGGGLLISSGHGAIPLAGTIRVENNRFIRTGGDCYVDGKNGALWIHAQESDIEAAIVVRNLDLLDSAHAGITIHGPRALRNATFEHILMRGPNERGIHLLPSAGEVRMKTDDLRIERTALDAE